MDKLSIKRAPMLIALAVIFMALYLFFRPSASKSTPENGYRTTLVERGKLIGAVSATGVVNPTTTVIVGTQLSGQVIEILADYNSPVKAGQIVTRLNTDQLRARYDGAKADLAQAIASRKMQDASAEKNKADQLRLKATLKDVEAQLNKTGIMVSDAEKTLSRQQTLAKTGIASGVALQSAQTQRDSQLSSRTSAQAQIESTKAQIASLQADAQLIDAQKLASDAQVAQREAQIRAIEVDLGNSLIRAPVDGTVIQRNIELGQTVAASLQSPTLFLIAQDLTNIDVYANIDEADVGRVQEGQRVEFSVTAFPARQFIGTVKQIRLGAQTVQNVVTYTAVINVQNNDMALKPGMTATLRVLTEERENVLKISNAALRWRPPNLEADTAPRPAGVQEAAGQGGRGAGDGRGQGGGQGGAPNPAEAARALAALFDQVKTQLKPTIEQIKQLDALAEEQKAARASGTRPAGGFREARAALMEKITSILTPEQQTAFAKLRADLAANRTQRTQSVSGRAYRLDEKGEAISTPLQLGVSDGAFTEVVSGVNEAGAKFITGGGPSLEKKQTMRFGF